MKTVNLCMSGGRTSANLVISALWLRAEGLIDIEPVITFANTGREHEKTLEFINKCDKYFQETFGFKVVWLEAVVHDGRVPCSHKEVDFDTADREGNVFEEVVAKYGLPNGNFLHCTRELKENPILSYMKSLDEEVGHIFNGKLVSATYETWIGIRKDEPKRLQGNRDGKQKKVFPLAEGFGIKGDDEYKKKYGSSEYWDLLKDKQDILDFWEDMPFDLDLPEHLGNCVDCHKKSNKKLAMVYKETPEVFNFTAYLDNQYSKVKAQVLDGKIIKRKRFRGYLDTKELIATFKVNDFNPKTYEEESGGCGESCEPFMMDNIAD